MLGAGPVIVEPVFKLGSVWCHCPALDARAVVFQLHSTEPYGFPQVLPRLLWDGGCEEGSSTAAGLQALLFLSPRVALLRCDLCVELL